MAGAAWLGSALVLAIVMAVSRRIKDIMVILILGMMLGSGISSVVEILQYLSSEAALKSFVIWTSPARKLQERTLHLSVKDGTIQ